MKKVISIVACAVLLLSMLTACGEKEFECALCEEIVTGKPNVITQDGVSASLCDDCFEMYEEFGSFLE